MIVVVDDELDAGDILVRLLKRTGYDAVAKTCAADLFDHLRDHTPALIILDVNMPKVDGLGCLRQIRDNAAWRDIPVIMYSANFSDVRMKDAQRLGAREYVVKGTLRWTEFTEIINRHLAKP